MARKFKALLVVLSVALVAPSITSREAKADSFADGICGQLDDASSSVLSRWCVATYDAFVDLLLIPTLYDLQTTDIHPSTVSASLDGIYEDFTEYLWADIPYFIDADDPNSSKGRWRPDCAGLTCIWTNSETGRLYTRTYGEPFSGRGIQWTPLGQDDGVTLAKRERWSTEPDSDTDYDYTRYGGWANESAFFVYWRIGVAGTWDGYGSAGAYTAGVASRSNPVALTARWSGFMSGVDVSDASSRGNFILGKADVRFDGQQTQHTVDVSFTDVYDIATLDPRADMAWYDLPVQNGAFSRGSDTNSIQGRFYGSQHQEVGGVFERNRISGAFGATKQ